MKIEDLQAHCVEQMRKLPKTSKMYEELLLTLAVIDTNKKYFDEIEKKDKIIDLMAKYINYLSDDLIQATGKNELEFCDGNKCCKDSDYSCEQCIKQYFERKVEDESND